VAGAVGRVPVGGGGLARAVAFASALPAACLAGGLLGAGLDHLVGSGPWMTVGGVLLGFGGGVFQLLRSGAEGPAEPS